MCKSGRKKLFNSHERLYFGFGEECFFLSKSAINEDASVVERWTYNHDGTLHLKTMYISTSELRREKQLLTKGEK
jgi:hypothetical protein